MTLFSPLYEQGQPEPTGDKCIGQEKMLRWGCLGWLSMDLNITERYKMRFFLFICLRFMPGTETVAHILSLNERAALSMEPGRLIQTQWLSARWCFGWIQVPTVD